MTKYPNREALRKAHDIYRDAMRQFVVRCLKRVRGERIEDLILNSLDSWEKKQFKQDLQKYESPEASIDIDHFPKIIRRYWSRDSAFSQEFDFNSKIRYKTGAIVEGRNFWAHPGLADVELAHTHANLTQVAEVLGEIKNPDAKEAVENIRDRLFSDESKEHPLEAENAASKEQISDMTKQLETAKAEKAKYEKVVKDAANQLATLKKVNAQLEDRLEVTSTRLEDVEMACEILKQKIQKTLKTSYFNDAKDFVDVSDGAADFIHVVVVSRKFNGHTMIDRGDIIWDELLKHLSDEEWGHVSLLIGATPEEVQLW